MFNLMSNCCSWVSNFQQPMRKVTVLMVGLDNAGKTSILRSILKVPPKELGPTQGCVRTELRVDNFIVMVLDMGGSPEDRRCWRDYYGEAHGIIFVVDSSDEQRLPEAKELLVDMLKQPRVARKPLLVLANKQDRMDALLISELIEGLSLEKLVNQSRSLCHIEPCSALVDLRKWSDRKTLRGLRWLLRAVCMDYSDLCSRVARDSKHPVTREDKERRGKPEKTRGKPKNENTLKKKLKMKKKQVKIKDTMDSTIPATGEEDGEEQEEGQETGQRQDRSNGTLLPKNRGKTGRKSRKGNKEGTEPLELRNVEKKKKKKKVVKVKKKNKINSEGIPAAYSQPVDLSATFDLYRKAILSLKTRQEQQN
uniref:ADP-ribosylation factor-like 13A n=1 Tax=Scleropages formosus TaxID=113540 RepID=A0A8C9RGT8_SCLFO